MSNYFVHESSYVEEGSFIGSGTKIWYFSHVMSGASIGSNCIGNLVRRLSDKKEHVDRYF